MLKPEPGKLLALRTERARPLFDKWLRDEELAGRIAALADLDRAGIPHEEVRTDEYTGKRFFFFRDPDNLPIEIYNDVAS